MLTQPDLQPSQADDPGWDGQFNSFGPRKPVHRAKLRLVSPPEQEPYDDTFRLREAQLAPVPKPALGRMDSGKQIIEGEHQTLSVLGKIGEAMDADDDDSHILEHRIMLANDNLSETGRAALMEHISSHQKSKKRKLKAVAETDAVPTGIPQKPWSPDQGPQSAERRRSAGLATGMESRMKKFDAAVNRAYGRGAYGPVKER